MSVLFGFSGKELNGANKVEMKAFKAVAEHVRDIVIDGILCLSFYRRVSHNLSDTSFLSYDTRIMGGINYGVVSLISRDDKWLSVFDINEHSGARSGKSCSVLVHNLREISAYMR